MYASFVDAPRYAPIPIALYGELFHHTSLEECDAFF
jgi:hypothetical protein